MESRNGEREGEVEGKVTCPPLDGTHFLLIDFISGGPRFYLMLDAAA